MTIKSFFGGLIIAISIFVIILSGGCSIIGFTIVKEGWVVLVGTLSLLAGILLFLLGKSMLAKNPLESSQKDAQEINITSKNEDDLE